MLRVAASFGIAASMSLALAGSASATNESATIGMKMDPLAGGLTRDSYKPVNWQIETVISTPDATIEPLKESNLSLPDGSLTFNPDPKMPVCGDDKINASSVSVPVETAIAACPNSIIGNGRATFALGQQTAISRDGVILVFNGGLQKSGPLKGQPRIMVYAYSYDTGVGVYSEAALSRKGDLDFKVPQLTADSSVTSLSLNIPGKEESLYVASLDKTVKLPTGQDNTYAQARCATGKWNYGAQFLLGDRNTAGEPTSPTTELNETGVQTCSGSGGRSGVKFAGLKIKGPGSVKAGQSGTFKVTVKNTGKKTAKGGKVTVSGKGVKGTAKFGKLRKGKSTTIKVKVRFSSKGKIKANFKASASGSSKTTTKTVKVK